jgi:hypothetical protein
LFKGLADDWSLASAASIAAMVTSGKSPASWTPHLSADAVGEPANVEIGNSW